MTPRSYSETIFTRIEPDDEPPRRDQQEERERGQQHADRRPTRPPSSLDARRLLSVGLPAWPSLPPRAVIDARNSLYARWRGGAAIAGGRAGGRTDGRRSKGARACSSTSTGYSWPSRDRAAAAQTFIEVLGAETVRDDEVRALGGEAARRARRDERVRAAGAVRRRARAAIPRRVGRGPVRRRFLDE